MDARTWFRHPSIRTALGTGVGYLLILAALLVTIFLVPYGIFTVV